MDEPKMQTEVCYLKAGNYDIDGRRIEDYKRECASPGIAYIQKSKLESRYSSVWAVFWITDAEGNEIP